MNFKTLLLIAFALSGGISGHCSTALPPSARYLNLKQRRADSLPRTGQDFMEQYGKDDSSRALIRFFFYKQKNHKSKRTAFWIMLGLGLFFLGLTIALSRRWGDQDVLDAAPQEGIALSSLAVAGAGAVGVNVYTERSRMRRKLIQALEEYRVYHFVRTSISNNLYFRLSLRGEPEEQMKIYKKTIRSRHEGSEK